MKHLSFALAALLAGLTSASIVPAAWADNPNPLPVKAGDLVISQIWARASNAPTGVIYLTIADQGSSSDKLLGVHTDAANMAMLHQSTQENAVSRMRMVKSLDIPAHGSVTLQPGGYHIMLMGLKGPLKAGTRIEATLSFARAGAVQIEVPVQALGLGAPQSGVPQAAASPSPAASKDDSMSNMPGMK